MAQSLMLMCVRVCVCVPYALNVSSVSVASVSFVNACILCIDVCGRVNVWVYMTILWSMR